MQHFVQFKVRRGWEGIYRFFVVVEFIYFAFAMLENLRIEVRWARSPTLNTCILCCTKHYKLYIALQHFGLQKWKYYLRWLLGGASSSSQIKIECSLRMWSFRKACVRYCSVHSGHLKDNDRPFTEPGELLQLLDGGSCGCKEIPRLSTTSNRGSAMGIRLSIDISLARSMKRANWSRCP